MSVTNALAGIAVNDLGSSIAWYAQLLGRQPDSRPMEEVAEWEFERGGWIQVFEDKERAGCSSVTLVETDVARRTGVLKKAAIRIVSEMKSEEAKLVIIHDHDGNRIVFARGRGERHRAVASA